MAGHEEDELALAVLVERPEAGGLLVVSLLLGLHLHLFAQIEIEFGGGDDAVALAFGHQVGIAFRQRIEQGQGEGRVQTLLAGPRAALGIPGQHVERLLIVGGGGEHLPGGGEQVAVVAFLVQDLGQCADVAGGCPAEGAGEAAVEDGEHVAAGQRGQPGVQVGHGEHAGGVAGYGVLGDQVAGRAVVAVERDAVAGEVDEQAVVVAEAGRQFFGEERAQPLPRDGLAGGRLGQQECLVAVRGAQQFLQPCGVVDRGGQRRDAAAVGVDADDDGQAAPELVHGQRGAGRLVNGRRRAAVGVRCVLHCWVRHRLITKSG